MDLKNNNFRAFLYEITSANKALLLNHFYDLSYSIFDSRDFKTAFEKCT